MNGSNALPVPLRRAAAATAVLSAVVVLALGLRYEGLGTPTRTDERLDGLVAGWTSGSSRTADLVQNLGNPVPVVLMAGLLGALALATGRRRLAVLAVLGPGLTGLATTGLKPLFDRTLSGTPAYPSGHTAALTALAIVAALLLASLIGVGTVASGLLLAVLALGAGTAMAVALTTLDIHYPTDTIGGFGTAVAVVLGVALVLDRVAEARRTTTAA